MTVQSHCNEKIPSLPCPYALEFTPPSQPTIELERSSRKQRLAASYRIFGRFGFDMGTAGHITARDPERTDHFWVNPLGIHFTRMCVSDLMLVNHEAQIVVPPARAQARLNVAAFAIHSQLHRARPDVMAAAHSHSLYGKAFSTLGKLLDPISQDATAFYEDHALYPHFSGPIVDPDEGRRIGDCLGDRHAVILQNHGLLTVGQTVESCIWRYLAMENACQTQLIAAAAGVIKPVPHQIAQQSARLLRGESLAYNAFQPYWEWITAEEPGLLE
jgi:ribulose-5-phosphate 4-epimerase/fuculose-1-phosphate aldolase